MAAIDKTKTEDKSDFIICWARGDADPKAFTLKDSAGVPIDVSTWTFNMAVNTDRDPSDVTNEIFEVGHTFVTDGTDGQIQFTPPPGSLDAVAAPSKAFYDVNRLTPSKKTLVKGIVEFVMDVDKT